MNWVWILGRVVTCSALVIVLAGCAEQPTQGSGTAAGANGTSSIEQAVDVARIVCRGDGIRLEDAVARAQRDGVHISVENPGNAWGVEMHHGSAHASGSAAGMKLSERTTRSTWALAPGTVTVACMPTSRSAYSDPGIVTDTLTVVDPDGLWVPWELTCGFGDQFRMKIEAAPDEDPLTVLRRLPGVVSTDVVERPKYPGSDRYSPMEFIVFRDGIAIVRVMGPYFDRAWHLLIDACPGSGVAPS